MNENATREAEAEPRKRAMAWTNQGLILVRQQRFQEALGCFEEALALFQQSAEPMRVAEQWGNIGSAYRDLEKPDRALENYQQADGSIRVPDVLKPYMGGIEVIG